MLGRFWTGDCRSGGKGDRPQAHYAPGSNCAGWEHDTRWHKQVEAREVAAEMDEEALRRVQELADERAALGPCAHCGRDPVAGYAMAQDAQLCHPHDPRLPDCYRRVTVYYEPLGALLEMNPKPPGVEAWWRGHLPATGDDFMRRWERRFGRKWSGT